MAYLVGPDPLIQKLHVMAPPREALGHLRMRRMNQRLFYLVLPLLVTSAVVASDGKKGKTDVKAANLCYRAHHHFDTPTLIRYTATL